MILEKVIKATQIETKLLTNEPKPLLVHANDIVGNIVITVKKMFRKLETKAKKSGLMVNEENPNIYVLK